MKTLKFLLAGAVALMAFAGCSDDVEEPFTPNQENNQNQETEYDETYYAENASISCSDPKFTVTDDGVVVSFKVSGGEITIDVDCGTEWTAQNSAEDIFNCSIKSTSVTITAGQNLVEAELTGTIMLVTMPSQIEFATITVTQDAYGSPEITVETNEWHIPAVGELSTEITVNANYDWQVERCDDWLKIEVTETGIILTAEENTETTEREGEVVLTCADEFKSDSATIKVTQDGRAYITLSEDKLLVSSFPGSVSITVESNYDWEFVCDVVWLTVTQKNNSLTIEYLSNGTGNDREGAVSITAGDGAVNVTEAELKITQSWENIDALIFEYTAGTGAFEIPLRNVTNVTIDWGDDTTTTGTWGSYDNWPSHSYSTSGTYYITINGNVTNIVPYGNEYSSYHTGFVVETRYIKHIEYLTAVIQWGNTGLTSMANAFKGCTGLTSLPEENDGAFAHVTSFKSCFEGCTELTTVPDGLFSGCSSATSFESCFEGLTGLTTVSENLFSGCSSATFKSCFSGCKGLTAIPEGLFSGCSSAKSFESCFSGCKGLTAIPEGLFSGCSATTSFSSCFSGCTGLTAIPEGLFSGCSAATSFSSCFSGCTGLTAIPEGLFSSCSSATSFKSCFTGCTGLTSAPLFKDCSKVTSFEETFYGCTSLTTIPENMFYGCTASTTFMNTFYNCSTLTSAPSFENCSKVATFESTFSGCSALTTVPEKIFSGCTAVTTFNSTFSGCSSLKCVPVSLFDDTLLVTNFGSTFNGCSSISGESPYTEVDVEGKKVNVHLYQRSNYPEYMGCSTPTSYSNCFTDSTFSDIDSIPSSWGGNGN